jgi:hypothetical protein
MFGSWEMSIPAKQISSIFKNIEAATSESEKPQQ